MFVLHGGWQKASVPAGCWQEVLPCRVDVAIGQLQWLHNMAAGLKQVNPESKETAAKPLMMYSQKLHTITSAIFFSLEASHFCPAHTQEGN